MYYLLNEQHLVTTNEFTMRSSKTQHTLYIEVSHGTMAVPSSLCQCRLTLLNMLNVLPLSVISRIMIIYYL